jgi:hypothetical protein
MNDRRLSTPEAAEKGDSPSISQVAPNSFGNGRRLEAILSCIADGVFADEPCADGMLVKRPSVVRSKKRGAGSGALFLDNVPRHAAIAGVIDANSHESAIAPKTQHHVPRLYRYRKAVKINAGTTASQQGG